ncbi:hypothetical protein V2E24_01585 [Mycoplasmopsis ciconiae]|uniref:Uncharacterized protein n=1 Tax=Mycoplasmopsis ciconiae TaxID=561067 RepID=A0ABU7MLX0_9BACT|nr:hypothetical protein [Mycoplasmopsis ciconiae]
MLKDYQVVDSKDIDLSFDFEIEEFTSRHFEIKIKKTLRDLHFSKSYCEWFIEDFLDFLASNKYQLRWDVEYVHFNSAKNLNLSQKDFEILKDFLENKVMNFDIKIDL